MVSAQPAGGGAADGCRRARPGSGEPLVVRAGGRGSGLDGRIWNGASRTLSRPSVGQQAPVGGGEAGGVGGPAALAGEQAGDVMAPGAGETSSAASAPGKACAPCTAAGAQQPGRLQRRGHQLRVEQHPVGVRQAYTSTPANRGSLSSRHQAALAAAEVEDAGGGGLAETAGASPPGAAHPGRGYGPLLGAGLSGDPGPSAPGPSAADPGVSGPSVSGSSATALSISSTALSGLGQPDYSRCSSAARVSAQRRER
ncbi:hypothetical protein SFUMM280S_09970 [Streptomyces fumanus]